MSSFDDVVFEAEPGATCMWFGKYQGSRLDSLDEAYRRRLIHLYHERPHANLVKFHELHQKYLAWLDERQSPLSTIIWFGKYKGHEMRVLYEAPNRWKWHLRNNTTWRNDLMEISQRYREWKLRNHRRRNYGPRARPEIVNPKGKSLGLRDDGIASDNDDDYISDDGFVVADDASSDSDNTGRITDGSSVITVDGPNDGVGNYHEDLSDSDDLELWEEGEAKSLEEEGGRHIDRSPCPIQNSISEEDSDSSTLPSLEQIAREGRIPARPAPGMETIRFLRRAKAPSVSPELGSPEPPDAISVASSVDRDQDRDRDRTPDPPSPRLPATTSPLKRKGYPRLVDSSEDSDSDDEPVISPSKRSPLFANSKRQKTTRRAHQAIDLNGLSPSRTGPKLRTGRNKEEKTEYSSRATRNNKKQLDSGSESYDSDDEPLLPKWEKLKSIGRRLGDQ